MAWLFLAVAIVAETLATSNLKLCNGFTRFWPSMIVVVGYGTAFGLMSLTLRTIPVGIAYAVWCGVGMVLIAGVGWLVFGERLDTAGMCGIALILAGVLVLSLVSRTHVA